MRQSNNLHLEHLGVKVGSVFPPKYPDNTCSHGTTPNRKTNVAHFTPMEPQANCGILVTASYLLPQHVDGSSVPLQSCLSLTGVKTVPCPQK